MDNNVVQNGYQNGPQLETPLSLGEWVLTIFVLGLPCIGLVMMFVWGFGKGNMGRKNYCRAMLIFAAIGIVLGIIFSASLVAIVSNAFNS